MQQDKRHFNVTDEQLAERLGVKAISVPSEPENVPFEGLVEGGWFKRYLEYTSQSEAPAQFHFGAVMVAAAASLMRRPAIQWGALPTYPNLYALLIGPTGSRKSTSMAIAADIVKRAVPGMNVLPADGTHQGYASALRRRWAENTVTADGLILASEYGVLLSRERHKSELPKWLTDWYDRHSASWRR